MVHLKPDCRLGGIFVGFGIASLALVALMPGKLQEVGYENLAATGPFDQTGFVPNPSLSPVPGNAGYDERNAIARSAGADIWTLIRDHFMLPDKDAEPVHVHLSRFQRDPDNVEHILTRSRPYLHHIAKEVHRRGLPAELALLPAIESAFDPFAESPRGAAGLWQFMPATASALGLESNEWYDGRRDVIVSTRAALDYLTALHQRFKQDWLTAIAAYNAGPARLSRAIAVNRDSGKPIDFWYLRLPAETRNYVSKVLALSRIVEAPSVFGVDLPHVPDAPHFAVVDVEGPLDFEVATGLADVSLETVRRLNPGFSRQLVHSSGPHRLALPLPAAARFTEGIRTLSEAERTPWVRHRIRWGDTLSGIADRYGITLAQLQQVNQLVDSTIIAGDLLIVPVVSS